MKVRLPIPIGAGTVAAGSLLVASVCRYAAQLILVLLAARTYGGRPVDDIFLGIAIAAPSFVLLNFGLRELSLTLDRDASFATYLQVRAATTLLAIAIPSVVAAVLGGQLGAVVVLMALGKAADSIVDLASAYLQAEEKFWQIAVYALISSVLGVTGWFAAGAISHTFLVQVGGYVAGGWIVALNLLILQIRHQRHAPSSEAGAVRHILRAGFPLGLSAGFMSLAGAVPQYVLSSLGFRDASTKFALLIYVGVVAEILLNALSTAWLSRAKKLRQAGHLTATRVWLDSARTLVIVIPTCVLAFFVLSNLATRGLVEVHRLGWSYLPPILVGSFLMPAVLYFSTALSIVNRYRRAFDTSAVTFVFVLIGSLTLIPLGGLMAALWLNAASVAIRVLVSFLAFIQPGPKPPSSTSVRS